MNRTEKSELMNVLRDKFSKAQVAIFADYKGLKALDADDFRKKVRATNGKVVVLKNNIARQAVKDGSLGEPAKKLMNDLVGPTLVAFGMTDAASTSKVVHQFAKEHDEFQIKESLLGQDRLTVADVEALGTLPAREVLLAMALGVLNGPARGFVSVLAGVPRAFVTVLQAVADKKGGTQES